MNLLARAGLASMQAQLDRWTAAREKKVSFPAEAEIFSDLPYLDDDLPCHRLDICRPKSCGEPLPVIVHLHGGGLLLCTKEVSRQYCGTLAARGTLVFSLEYPLVPEKNVFEILSDIAEGLNTVEKMIPSFGGDPGRVVLTGDSAGAFLGIYTAAAQNSTAVRNALGFPAASLRIGALGLISGMFYTIRPDSIGLPLRRDFYGRNWKTHPFYPYMNPEHPEIAGNLPPCFFVTSKLDSLRRYTVRYASAFRRAGGLCELHDYPADLRLSHAFSVIMPELPASQDAITRMFAFFSRTAWS